MFANPAIIYGQQQQRVDPECQFFDFFGKKVAYFFIENQKMICLLQVYELFLKQLVGGLHTIYTKMRRLNINPSVCTIDQVRALRLVGAIQNGVNRCKLIEMSDLERLIEDCSDIRSEERSPNENSSGYEKSGSSSAKPFGNNSETDDSFEREKSMSATDQDSSNSGQSSSQSGSSPNSQSLQFLLNKLISLIETTESVFKSHCHRLGELSCELHKQINEILQRERSAQLGLYLQRQKTALYQRRYITKKFAPYRHKKSHKSAISTQS